MKSFFSMVLTVALLFACGAGGAAEVPAALAALIDDEAAFIEALREGDEAELASQAAARAKLEEMLGVGDVEAAKKALDEARTKMAGLRAAYEAGLERYPKNAELHNYYGEMLYDQYGEEEEGVRRWHKAKDLDPKLSLAYNNLGIHYMHVGAYALGLEHLDKAIKLDGKHPDFLFNMVQAYMNHAPFIEEHRGWKPSRIYKEAMKLSKRAVKNAPEDYELLTDYALNFWKAESLDAKADWKDAAKAWEAARPHASKDDERFFTWLMEARAWIQAERKVRAVVCLDAALKLNPASNVAKRLREQLAPKQAA